MANENERPRAGVRGAVLGGRRAAAWADTVTGGFFPALRHQIDEALRAEADAARLAPWLPVVFGVGILLYFVAPHEPSLIAGSSACFFFALVAFFSRERPFAFALSLALSVTAAGFAIGTLRGYRVAHPMQTKTTQTVVHN
jgi:competence protein ComEC